MSGFELIDGYSTLNQGRIALNNMYSGMTIYLSGSSGTDSLIRNNNSQNLKNRATGSAALAGGIANAAGGSFTLAFWGSGNTANTAYSTVINGKKNSVLGSSGVGNGLSTIITGSGNTLTGDFSLISHGIGNTIDGSQHSTIIGGYQNIINGNSTLMAIIGGSGNTINGSGGFSGKHSVIVGGYFNYIGGGSSIGSVVIGGNTNSALGEYSVVLGGIGNTARAMGSVAMGGGAEATQTFTFSIGGTNTTTSSPINNTISLHGVTGVGMAEGGFFTGPADIAEMFQYLDGNPTNEDRRGLFVSITSGGTVKVGNENIIGIVSANPGYVGDSAELKWAGVYLKDKFGSRLSDKYKMFTWSNRKKEYFRVFQNENGQQYKEYPNPMYPTGILYDGDSIPLTAKTEDIEVMRINPEYNPEVEYVPRSKRQEWSPIGLLGKINVRTAEEITGTHVDADENGMAVNGTKYPVLKQLKPFSEPYGIVQIFLR
jgi:hypothetical protein